MIRYHSAVRRQLTFHTLTTKVIDGELAHVPDSFDFTVPSNVDWDAFKTSEFGQIAAELPAVVRVSDWSGIKTLWSDDPDRDAENLAERIERGTVSVQDLMRGIVLARQLSDADLLLNDMFGPDESDILPLEDKVVRGRKAHVDSYSGVPIAIGERPRWIKEKVEGDFVETRHSELSCWLAETGRGMHVDFDKGALRPSQEFVAKYEDAQNRILMLEAEGSI